MAERDAKKIALVTGGSRGIGKAIACELLQNQFEVFICGRKINDLKSSVDNLSSLGKINYYQLDISRDEHVRKFVKEWDTPLNVLINNAGICGSERLEDEFGIWGNILATNLNGLYYLTKGLLKWIHNDGSVVNISSQLGTEGRAGFGAYCASKHALLGLTKCWAKELGHTGITVNAVCPGWVKTEMAMSDVKKMAQQRNISEEQMYVEITDELDLKRFIEPMEVAQLVAFLVSAKARGITGQVYHIK